MAYDLVLPGTPPVYEIIRLDSDCKINDGLIGALSTDEPNDRLGSDDLENKPFTENVCRNLEKLHSLAVKHPPKSEAGLMDRVDISNIAHDRNGSIIAGPEYTEEVRNKNSPLWTACRAHQNDFHSTIVIPNANASSSGGSGEPRSSSHGGTSAK